MRWFLARRLLLAALVCLTVLAVTLAATPALLPDKATVAAREDAQASGGLGLALAPLDGAARETLKVPPEVKGAVIAAVRSDSPASEAGLRPGYVVVSVGSHPVAAPADAAKAISERPGGTGVVALRVLREGHSLFVAVPGTLSLSSNRLTIQPTSRGVIARSSRWEIAGFPRWPASCIGPNLPSERGCPMTPANMRRIAVALSAAVLAAGPAGAQISDDVVRIGVSTDHNGVNSAATGLGTVAAVRLAVRDFGGTVAGKPVEVVVADDQGKPDVGAGNVRAWVNGGKVDAVVGGGASSIALAVQTIMREQKKVFLVTGAGASDLTGKACSPTTIHLAYDSFALAASTGRAVLERGADTWFFITADYAFGTALERDATRFITGGGGKVLGSVRHPTSISDFSSYLLQAQASGAKVIGLATSGQDMVNVVKQAQEFGIQAAGQKLAGLLLVVNDVQGIGLQSAQGLLLSESFYWDMNDETRAWSKRYMAEFGGKVPKRPS